MQNKKDLKKQMFVIVILLLFGMLLYQLNFSNAFKVEKKGYTIYIETGKDTNEYVIQTSPDFPVENYFLNKQKTNSECANAIVSQNSNKTINFQAYHGAHCNIYFDYGENDDEANETLEMLHSLNSSLVLNPNKPDLSYTPDGVPHSDTSAEPDPTKVSIGIYKDEDDYGTTYYFRGNVENNYVKFAGKDWRIVRINEDGTIRLILDGFMDNSDFGRVFCKGAVRLCQHPGVYINIGIWRE